MFFYTFWKKRVFSKTDQKYKKWKNPFPPIEMVSDLSKTLQKGVILGVPKWPFFTPFLPLFWPQNDQNHKEGSLNHAPKMTKKTLKMTIFWRVKKGPKWTKVKKSEKVLFLTKKPVFDKEPSLKPVFRGKIQPPSFQRIPL